MTLTDGASQENLRKIWPRFTYVRYRREMTQRMRALGYDTEEMLGESIPESEDLGSDAFDTLMEVLHAKLADRERSEAGGQAM